MEFRSFSATSKTIGAASTSTASASAALPGQGSTVRIVNEGPNICYISIGAGAQTATVPSATPLGTATPIPVGDITLTIAADAIYNFSLINRATQTSAVVIQVGEGN